MADGALVVRARHDPQGLYTLIKDQPDGINKTDLVKQGWDITTLLKATNVLLGKNQIEMVKMPSGDLRFHAIDPQLIRKLQGLDEQHRMVLKEVQRTGDQGLWRGDREFKMKTQLPTHAIARITKELMSRQLIKEVKTVNGRSRKVFMDVNIKPAEAVTGGSMFIDGEFAREMIEALRERCLDMLQRNPGRTVKLHEVYEHVVQEPIRGSTKPPSEDFVSQVLRTLELDERCISTSDGNGERVYQLRPSGALDVFAGRMPSFHGGPPPGEGTGLQVPCLSCHLAGQCQPGGIVCPDKCEYMAHWLRPLGGQGASTDW